MLKGLGAYDLVLPPGPTLPADSRRTFLDGGLLMGDVTLIANARESAVRLRVEQERTPKIHLLGRMRAVAPDGHDLLPRLRKTRALFAYLCLAGGERVSRSRLAGLLWDRSSESQARQSLRRALSELNETFGAFAAGLIESDRESVRLDVGACWIDVFDSNDQPRSLLEDLDGVSPSFDQWLATERARFEDRVRNTLEGELDRLVEEHAPPGLRAVAARRLIGFEPTHEGAVRSLIKALIEMGERAQAIREYHRCRKALEQRLDVQPSRETTALYEAARLVSSSRRPAPDWVLPVEPEQGHGSANNTSDGIDDAQTARLDRTRPSIAVLPFRSLSTEPRYDYAADGLVDDLIDVLSRIPGFFVISRQSTLAFRNEPRPPQEIGEALGVQYVISGSMRVVGPRLRLIVELSDTCRGTVLWHSRLDEDSFDLLEVQDRLAAALVKRIAPYLYATELKRVRLKRPESTDAYDLFLRAQENMCNVERQVFESAEQLFDEAIARDPQYAAALAWRSYWHVLRVGQGWSPDPNRDTEQAVHFADQAVRCDMLEPMGFAVQGHIASYLRKDFDLAHRCFEKALEINPNSALAWLWRAAARAWTGNGARAVEEADRAIALSPYDPLLYAYNGVAAIAHLAAGAYDRAVEYAMRSMQENRTYTTAYKIRIIALTLAGREVEARSSVSQLLSFEPDFTVDRFRQRSPTSASPQVSLYCAALAKVGIPLI